MQLICIKFGVHLNRVSLLFMNIMNYGSLLAFSIGVKFIMESTFIVYMQISRFHIAYLFSVMKLNETTLNLCFRLKLYM